MLWAGMRATVISAFFLGGNMDGWVTFDLAVVKNAMPSDIDNLRRTWEESNPGKAARLEELTAEMRGLVRGACKAREGTVMDPDLSTIPINGFRHAMNLVVFHLGMEMGVQFAPAVFTLFTSANVWLRLVAAGTVNPVPAAAAESEAGGTPWYQTARCRRRREQGET